MALIWCKAGCGELFDDAAHHAYCSDSCEARDHNRLLGQPQKPPSNLVPYSIPAVQATRSAPRPAPKTMSVAAAWLELSERAADFPERLAAEVHPLERRNRQ